MTTQLEARLIAEIGQIIDDYIVPIFQPGAHITVLVRHPGIDDADAVVTSDTDDGIHALLQRRFPRPADAEIARLSAALSEALAKLEAERARNAAIRDAALEDAAKLMDPYNDEGTLGAMNAESIRALKNASPLAIIPGAQP